MKYVGYAALLIASLALETTFSVGWDLVLLLALIFALIQGPFQGAIFGFLSGLTLDLFLGRFVGLQAITTMLLALLIGLLASRLYQENFLVRFLAIFTGTVLGQIVYLLGIVAFGGVVFWSFHVWRSIFTTGLINAFLSLVVFRPFVNLNRRLIYWDEVLKRTG